MMSWNYIVPAFLTVFLSTIDVSKGGCKDHFHIKDLNQNLSAILPIVETKNLKDAMECSIERALLENTMNSKKAIALLICFQRQEKPQNITDKCKGNTSQDVTLYHFMCLTAKALQMTAEDIGHSGCEYDTVLEIYSVISKGFGQTTTLPTTTTTTAPTTTLPERTTASTTTEATTTVLPPTTTTTTTILSPTTTTTTVLSPTTTTTTVLSPTTTTTTTVLSPTTTATVTQSAVSGNNGWASEVKKDEQKTSSIDISRSFLLISLALNVILPLAVYLYMRSHRSEDYALPVNAVMYELNEAPADRPVAEIEPNSPVNRDGEEASHLMQASECDSVVTH